MLSLMHKTLTALLTGLLLVSGPVQQAEDPEPAVRLELDTRGPGQIRWREHGSGTYQVPAGTALTIETDPDPDSRLLYFEQNGVRTDAHAGGTLSFEIREDTNVTAVFDSGLALPQDRPFVLTEEETAIIRQYQAGDTESARDTRQKMVEAYGLQDWVDEQGFLTEAWFDEFGLYGAVRGGMQILCADPDIQSQTTRARSAGTVTAATVHNWYYPGGYMNGGVWTVNVPGFGERPSFCANGMYAPPAAGTPISEPELSGNSMLRKALYYGFQGPANRMDARGWNEAQQVIYTNDLVSMAVTGTALGAQIGGGWIWRSYGEPFWNEMKTWPEPPATFKVYLVETEGSGSNWQGLQKPYQPLAFYVDNPQGTLRLEKQDAAPSLTAGNSYYTLAGAQYTVYDQGGKTAGVLTTDVAGKSNTLTLPFGTYTCQETKAPQGYRKDPRSYTVTIGLQGTSTLQVLKVSDVPESVPVDLLLRKTADSGQPLAGAQFEVKFFPEGSDKVLRSWILESDGQGRVCLDDAHRISGDAFWKDADGKPCLPAGTLTIREVKAPVGYLADPAEQKLDTRGLTVWKAPEISNRLAEVILNKRQTGTEIRIPGTVFERQGPDGARERQTTDETGQVVFSGLIPGDHVIRETEAAPGYALSEEEIQVTVTEKEVLVNGQPQPEAGVQVENRPEDHSLQLIKKSSKGNVLEGAEFSLFDAETGTKPLWSGKTGADGILAIPDLEDGRMYWLQETAAPAGYEPDPARISLCLRSVPASGEGVLTVNGQDYAAPVRTDLVTVSMEEGILSASLVRINQAREQLPETGSRAGLQLAAAALGLLVLSLYLKRKETR